MFLKLLFFAYICVLPFVISTPLQPAIAADHDLSLLSHLVPRSSGSFHYAGISNYGQGTHQMATTELNFHAPVVALELTNHILRLTCHQSSTKGTLNKKMDVVFGTPEAFAQAKASWSRERALFLVTFHAGCGQDDNQRAYHKVRSLSFNKSGLCITAIYDDVSAVEAIREGEISFGETAASKLARRGVVISNRKRDLRIIPPHRFNRTLLISRETRPQGINLGVGFGVDNKQPGECPNVDAKVDAELDRKHKMVSLEDPTNEHILDDPNTPSRGERGEKRMRRRIIARRGDEKRSLADWIVHRIDQAAQAINKALHHGGHALQKVEQAFDAVGGKVTRIAAAIESIGQHLKNNQFEFQPLDKEFSFAVPTSDQLAAIKFSPEKPLSQFGGREGFGVAQFSSGAVYCVDCGASGKFAFSGTITFNLVEGLVKSQITMNGNLQVGFHLAVEKQVQNRHKLVQTLSKSMYPAFDIPGILDFLAIFKAQLAYSLEVTGETRTMVGINMEWPDINTTFDLNPQNGGSHLVSTGWNPTVSRTFMTDGSVQVAAAVALPLRFEFDIKLFAGILHRAITLVEQPRFTFTSGLSLQTEFLIDAETGLPTLSTSIGTEECSGGVPVKLEFDNLVALEGLPGGTKTLHEIKPKELFKGCIKKQSAPETVVALSGNGVSESSSASEKRSLTRRQTISPAPPPPGKPDTGAMTIENRLEDTFLTTNIEGQVVLDTHQRNCLQPTQFISMKDVIVSDASARLLHIYSDEITKYGVSRIRVHPPYSMPDTAKVVMLAESSNSSSSVAGYIPGDDLRVPHFPIACQMEKAPTKFFMAPAPKINERTGEYDFSDIFDTLKSRWRRDDLTGGKVLDCSLKALQFIPSGSAAHPDKTLDELVEENRGAKPVSVPFETGIDDVAFMEGPWGRNATGPVGGVPQ